MRRTDGVLKLVQYFECIPSALTLPLPHSLQDVDRAVSQTMASVTVEESLRHIQGLEVMLQSTIENIDVLVPLTCAVYTRCRQGVDQV